MTTHTCWVMLVLEWGNPLIFINTPWTMVAIPIQCGIGCLRVGHHSNFEPSNPPGEFGFLEKVESCDVSRCWLLHFLSFNVPYCLHSNNDPAQLVKFKWLTLLWLVTCFVCDLSIAATLVYIAKFSKSKTDFLAATNTLLDRLIMRTIQSGVITAAVAALHIVMVLKVYTVGKLYANIVFANLNGRKRQMQPLKLRRPVSVSNFATEGTSPRAVLLAEMNLQ
ncbi:hypothetical protein B0H13DRAFT_1893347 [Mycena leptocephala]|nr:hypothetical protein B0H13DRAFT_1893347 [Mycena leptocephala]